MNGQQVNNAPGGYVRTLQIVAVTLIIGMVMFASIMTALITVFSADRSEPAPLADMKDIFLLGSAGVALLAGFVAWQLYRKGVESAKNLTGSVHDKLHKYRSTLIVYLGLSEMGGLLACVCIFLTGDLRLLAVVAVSLLLLARGFVTKKRLVSELNLDWKEEEGL